VDLLAIVRADTQPVELQVHATAPFPLRRVIIVCRYSTRFFPPTRTSGKPRTAANAHSVAGAHGAMADGF